MSEQQTERQKIESWLSLYTSMKDRGIALGVEQDRIDWWARKIAIAQRDLARLDAREAQARVAALEAENKELRDAIEYSSGFVVGNNSVFKEPDGGWGVFEGVRIVAVRPKSRHGDILEAIAAARALAGKEGA